MACDKRFYFTRFKQNEKKGSHKLQVKIERTTNGQIKNFTIVEEVRGLTKDTQRGGLRECYLKVIIKQPWGLVRLRGLDTPGFFEGVA